MSLSNGWTGGQYSLFRLIFGTWLFFYFLFPAPRSAERLADAGSSVEVTGSLLYQVAPYFPNIFNVGNATIFVTGLLLAAAGLSLAFAIGWHDRIAAILLAYLWVCLLSRGQLVGSAGLLYVGWLLLAHACLPGAPYGSWAARGRVDPGGGWRMPQTIFAGGWLLMAIGYILSARTELSSPSWLDGTAVARVLDSPLARPRFLTEALLALPAWLLHLCTWSILAFELLFAPLALFRIFRPWLWTVSFLLQLAILVLLDRIDVSLGTLLLHLFTFNPSWIKPLPAPTERVFYDGQCGLCHWAVRFILTEDRAGDTFRFAPLDSKIFRSSVSETERARLGDTLVVQTAGGALLARSRAVIHVMQRLGGVWRLLGAMARMIPLAIRDRLYDAVAWSRHRLFRQPAQACPILPSYLKQRFDV